MNASELVSLIIENVPLNAEVFIDEIGRIDYTYTVRKVGYVMNGNGYLVVNARRKEDSE